jgi:hypothetical protein
MQTAALNSTDPSTGFRDINTGTWDNIAPALSVLNYADNYAFWAMGARCVRPNQ